MFPATRLCGTYSTETPHDRGLLMEHTWTSDNLTSLQSHILAEEKRHPGATGEFSWILSAIALATKAIGNKIRCARIEDVIGELGLENVQGDERDVIIISMTYGPDPVAGRTMQRFGPINSDVGWRRLNVLFTRAKNRMHIFSSMGSSDIIVSGTSKKGVISLKRFLEYCETGHLNQPKFTGKPPDSDFEIAVIKAMEERGYECEPQLGVAGYFLDIAVKDPNNPGRFLMGIECDGATYHSAKSARDRDRLRQEVLEGLGWEIHRIWSTDWFKNPEAQLEPIFKRLEKLSIKFTLKGVIFFLLS